MSFTGAVSQPIVEKSSKNDGESQKIAMPTNNREFDENRPGNREHCKNGS